MEIVLANKKSIQFMYFYSTLFSIHSKNISVNQQNIQKNSCKKKKTEIVLASLLPVYFSYFNQIFNRPHQWLSRSAFKTGRQEVPDSIPGLACRPRCLEFLVVFSETLSNTGWDPLKSLPRRAFFPQSQDLRVVIRIYTYNPTQPILIALCLI